MPDSEKLSYKFQRLREAIRTAILSGELTHKLPGERELARRFGANAKTISKALTDLTSEGMLVRQVGRGTFVAETAGTGIRTTGRPGQRVACLASEHVDRSGFTTLFEMVSDRLEQRGHHALRMIVPAPSGELAERCLPISQLRELSGILIMCSVPSAALLADLARRHIPAVLCNVASREIRCNAVIADYARGAFELTEHLIQLGHEQIQLTVSDSAGRCVDDFRRGYQTAMQRYGLEPLAPLNGSLDRGLSYATRPGAVVCLGAEQARVLKLRLDSASSDQRASMAAMALPHETHLPMGLTCYEIDTGVILDWAVRLVVDAAPGDDPREVIVPGTFQERGTCYPASARAVTPHQAVL